MELAIELIRFQKYRPQWFTIQYKNNLIEKMDAALSKRENKYPQKIRDVSLTSEEYNILRSGLMKKAEIKIPAK